MMTSVYSPELMQQEPSSAYFKYVNETCLVKIDFRVPSNYFDYFRRLQAISMFSFWVLAVKLIFKTVERDTV